MIGFTWKLSLTHHPGQELLVPDLPQHWNWSVFRNMHLLLNMYHVEILWYFTLWAYCSKLYQLYIANWLPYFQLQLPTWSVFGNNINMWRSYDTLCYEFVFKSIILLVYCKVITTLLQKYSSNYFLQTAINVFCKNLSIQVKSDKINYFPKKATWSTVALKVPKQDTGIQWGTVLHYYGYLPTHESV